MDRKLYIPILFAIAIFSITALDMGISRPGNIAWFFDLAFPPEAISWSIVWQGIQETLHIAYLGTLGGFILALPLALLASSNLFSHRVYIPVRWLLSALRVMPSILLAIIFVILVGLGPLAGVLAIILYTTGYLGKLLYEAFEGLPQSTLQALSSIGTSKLQLMRFAVIPDTGNSILSQLIFMFEYNIRHSSIIGIVGAGGIGFYLSSYLKFFEYGKVLTLLMIIFGMVVLIDAMSAWARRSFLDRTSTQMRIPMWRRAMQAAISLLRL